jgi:chitodextrinase
MAASTTYTYAVSAVGTNALESARSAAVNVTTAALAPAPAPAPAPGGDTQAPTVPLPFSSAATTTSSVTLTWGKSFDNIGVVAYNLYRGGVLIARVTGQSYVSGGLAAGTRYSFALEAVDAAGNKSARVTANASTATAAAKRRAS